MPISNYLRELRAKVGSQLLLMPSVAVVAYNEQGQILLVRDADTGVWVLPSGSIDPHESPANAAVREMWEETGLFVELVRIIGVYGGEYFQVTYSNGDKVTYIATVFEGRIIEGRMRPDGDETVEIGYFSESDLANLKLPQWARFLLPDAFRDRNHTYFEVPTWTPTGISNGRNIR